MSSHVQSTYQNPLGNHPCILHGGDCRILEGAKAMNRSAFGFEDREDIKRLRSILHPVDYEAHVIRGLVNVLEMGT